MRTALTRLEGGIRGGRRPALRVSGREGCGRVWPREEELELVQEGPMDRTPEPVVPDLVEALRQHMLQEAADALHCRQGHRLPAVMSRVLIAETDLAILDGEHAAMGQRDPVDVPAEVVQDLLRALDGRFAVDDLPLGPDHLGDRQVGPFLTHPIEQQATQELRSNSHYEARDCFVGYRLLAMTPLLSLRGTVFL